MDILSVLKEEHRTVAALFDEAESCEPGDERLGELAKTIERELTAHAGLEERLFYPELRDRAKEADERVDVFEAYTEHEVVKHLIAMLKSTRKRDELFKAELQVLGENVKHHVKEEESTVFALARELMEPQELDDIGERWTKSKARAVSRAAAAGGRGAKRTTGRKKTSRKR